MHWYILGAGAIGRLWAWLFKQGAIPTTRILRDRSTLRRWRHGRGIALQESVRVAFYSPAAEIIDSPAPIQLLVTTKAHDTLTALRAIQNRLQPGCQILLLQNGMGSSRRWSTGCPTARFGRPPYRCSRSRRSNRQRRWRKRQATISPQCCKMYATGGRRRSSG